MKLMFKHIKPGLSALIFGVGILTVLSLSIFKASRVYAAGEKYKQTSATTIIGNSGSYTKDVTFTKKDNGTFESEPINSNNLKFYSCVNRFIIKDFGAPQKVDDKTSKSSAKLEPFSHSCGDNVDKSIVVTYATTLNGGSAPGQTASGNSDEDNTCEGKSGAMGWILCPVVDLLDGALNWIDTQIQALLEVDSNKVNDPSLHKAWSVIRNIAYTILIPIMLVMVIGTAVGSDFVSSYTVKKALPRMVIAIIFMTLSWYVVVLLVNISNAAGSGVLGIITAPFREQMPASCQNGNLNLACLFSADNGVNGGNILRSILLLPQAAIGIIGLILILVFFGGTMVLFIGVAFLVLLLRQMFILALLLLAPLAILAWIFPGHDKLWKSWWGLFSKLLIMFPLIMVLIGVGRIFALLIDKTADGGVDDLVLNSIFKLIAYMIPYALIPLTFKFAGGAFATLSGAMNDRSKGLFDRQRKGRAAKLERMSQGNLFRGNNAVSKKASAALGYASHINRAGFNPKNMRRGMQAALAERDLQGMQENMEKNAAFKPFIGNDSLLMAATAGKGTEADARAYLEKEGQSGRELQQNLAHIAAAKKSMGERQFAMAAAVATAGTGTGYSGGPGEMLEAINRASGGDMALAGNMLAAAKSKAGEARRFDLSGAGFGSMYGEMQNIGRARNDDELGKAKERANTVLTDGALDANGPGAMLGGRGKSVENLVPAIQRRIDSSLKEVHAADQYMKEAQQTGEPTRISVANQRLTTAKREMQQTLASTAGLLDVASQISPENARMFADGIMHGTVTDVNGNQATVSQVIEMHRNNPEFTEMRREYGSQQLQQHRNAQAAMAGTPGQQPPLIP